MEASVSAAANVSILAMSVIFTVLIILIFTIKALVKFIPYEAPPAAPARNVSASSPPGQDDQVAAITASLAAHMGKRPDEFRIVNIQSR
ncbi:MAG: sodium pump decarboxylase gamma subunit [Nitrospinales bacterium]|jgi:sodium pump decarboxylase gamma subunit